MIASMSAKEPMRSTFERLTIPARDGFQLAGVHWRPAGAVRAVLQLCHGMSEYAARYAAFAEAANAAGIAVVGHDHRGHGHSVDGSTPLGHYADHDGWNKVIGDVDTVNEKIRELYPDKPIILFGHSMGSFIARGYVLRHNRRVNGSIVSATGFRMGLGNRALQVVAEVEALRQGPRTPSALMAKLVFGSFNLQFRPNRTGFDWLSRDPVEVDKYIADPLCGFDCSGRLWADLLGAVYAIEQQEAEPFRLRAAPPVFIFAGSRDPVSMNGLGTWQLARRYRQAGHHDVTTKRYRDGRHEMVNETNRAEVWRDVIDWTLRHA
jgi:alpha-beta hydrolase superfamily lysophospholipase